MLATAAILSLAEAMAALKTGRFVLVHDDKGRENEIDMVIAAEHTRPNHVATMRKDAAAGTSNASPAPRTMAPRPEASSAALAAPRAITVHAAGA